MISSASELVVIAGCGWVTPTAAGTIAEVLRSGPEASSAPPPAGYRPISDDLLEEYPGLSVELRGDKGAWVTAIALEHAIRDAALEPGALEPERVGMVLGCGLAGQLGMINFANQVRDQTGRFVTPINFPQTVGNYIAGALARGYDIRGPNVTLASGSASALDAIIEGCEFIAGGNADVVFAGGTDTLSPDLARGLAEPEVILSEGACLFVLERGDRPAGRGAVPLATIIRSAHLAGARETLPAASEVILSGASCRHPGAIFIEQWTGRCPGPAGAAAVAAAIGAALGHDVPITDLEDSATVSVGRVAVGSLGTSGDAVSAVIFADAAHRQVLQISIPER